MIYGSILIKILKYFYKYPFLENLRSQKSKSVLQVFSCELFSKFLAFASRDVILEAIRDIHLLY